MRSPAFHTFQASNGPVACRVVCPCFVSGQAAVLSLGSLNLEDARASFSSRSELEIWSLPYHIVRMLE
jgi:hypothetical protein